MRKKQLWKCSTQSWSTLLSSTLERSFTTLVVFPQHFIIFFATVRDIYLESVKTYCKIITNIFFVSNRPRSPEGLCGSVVEHRSAESEGLRFDSSWGLRIFFFLPRSWQDEKHLSLFLYRARYLPSLLLYLQTWLVLLHFIIFIYYFYYTWSPAE